MYLDMFRWSHLGHQDRVYNESSWSSRGREFNRISRRSNLLWKWAVRTNKDRHIWKNVDVKMLFWKCGWFVGGRFVWLFVVCQGYGEWRYMWPIMLCHILEEIRQCWVFFPEESLKERFANFLKDLCWLLRLAAFDISKVSPMCFLVKSWPLWMIYFEAPISVHFCLINLVTLWKQIVIKEFIFLWRLYEPILRIGQQDVEIFFVRVMVCRQEFCFVLDE